MPLCLPRLCSPDTVQIQRWYLHLQASPAMRSRLSPPEGVFLEAFAASRTAHLDIAVLKRLPEAEQSLASSAGHAAAVLGDGDGVVAPDAVGSSAESALRAGPNLEAHVFARATRDLTNSAWGNDGIVPKGAGFILAYTKVRDHVHNGNVELR